MQPSRNETEVGARAFLKWAGGKQRLLPELLRRLPDDAGERRHVEPFVGAGSLFFARRPHEALLADVNEDLILTYNAVRSALPDVLDALRTLDAEHSEETFRKVRILMRNLHVPESTRAAMFIYLNKTSYNGLYRVNKAGHYNVPFGRYTSPKIHDALGLAMANALLQRATLRVQDFGDTLASCTADDFVYLDPPYLQVRDTSFTGYTPDGFRLAEHVQLANYLRALHARGTKWLLSQADVPYARELYRGFVIERVSALRAINRDTNGRGKVTELLIRNYRR